MISQQGNKGKKMKKRQQKVLNAKIELHFKKTFLPASLGT
jgi:hypothetical protein